MGARGVAAVGRVAFRRPARFNQTTNNMKRILTTLSALALASTLSLAEDKPAGPPPGGPGGPGGEGKHERPNPEAVFKKLDANDDKSISLDEFKAGPMAQKDPARAAEIFKKIDKDGDGKVTFEEFKAGHPHHGGPGGPGGDKDGGKHGHGGPGGPGGPGGGGPNGHGGKPPGPQ